VNPHASMQNDQRTSRPPHPTRMNPRRGQPNQPDKVLEPVNGAAKPACTAARCGTHPTCPTVVTKRAMPQALVIRGALTLALCR
jgi:hypothetical protein